MTTLPKNITNNRVLRMIDNIALINPDCVFRVPGDMFCHSSKICKADEAAHEIKNFIDLYSIRPYAFETTWEVWYRKYDKNGFIVECCFTAHNKEIDAFNPSNVGPLD